MKSFIPFKVARVVFILLAVGAMLAGGAQTLCAALPGCNNQRGGLIVNEIWRPQDSPICLTNDTSLSNRNTLSTNCDMDFMRFNCLCGIAGTKILAFIRRGSRLILSSRRVLHI
jgi:hypothetical protein